MAQHRLPEADATIVAGHLVVEQDSKAGSLQARHRQSQKQAILETAPAERGRRQPGLVRDLAGTPPRSHRAIVSWNLYPISPCRTPTARSAWMAWNRLLRRITGSVALTPRFHMGSGSWSTRLHLLSPPVASISNSMAACAS